MADCAAIFHLPVISAATKAVYGEDFLAGMPAVAAYLAQMEQRPNVQTVNAARVANYPAFMACIKP